MPGIVPRVSPDVFSALFSLSFEKIKSDGKDGRDDRPCCPPPNVMVRCPPFPGAVIW